MDHFVSVKTTRHLKKKVAMFYVKTGFSLKICLDLTY